MSGTRRVPLARRSARQITPRALAAFCEIQRLEAVQCTCLPGREGECPRCAEWWAQQSLICDELALPCWHFPAIEYEGMAEWRPSAAAVALWELFEAAASERTAIPPKRKRKRKRRQRTEPVGEAEAETAESEGGNFPHSDLPSEPVA